MKKDIFYIHRDIQKKYLELLIDESYDSFINDGMQQDNFYSIIAGLFIDDDE